MYVRTLEPPPTGEDDPLALGAEVYGGNCSSCHGASGGGGAGAQLSDGAVVENWPDWRDQAAWVRLGSAAYPSETYGALAKPTGGTGTMPGWETLTDQQIAEVVLHERSLGGEDVAEDGENAEALTDLWAVARGEMTLVEAGLGELSQAAGVTEEALGG
jgi:mono/diheme cytochrome c family protein